MPSQNVPYLFFYFWIEEADSECIFLEKGAADNSKILFWLSLASKVAEILSFVSLEHKYELHDWQITGTGVRTIRRGMNWTGLKLDRNWSFSSTELVCTHYLHPSMIRTPLAHDTDTTKTIIVQVSSEKRLPSNVCSSACFQSLISSFSVVFAILLIVHAAQVRLRNCCPNCLSFGQQLLGKKCDVKCFLLPEPLAKKVLPSFALSTFWPELSKTLWPVGIMCIRGGSYLSDDCSPSMATKLSDCQIVNDRFHKKSNTRVEKRTFYCFFHANVDVYGIRITDSPPGGFCDYCQKLKRGRV